VVRRNVEHIEGADDVVGTENLVDALAGADVVFLTLSLTDETRGIIGRAEMEVMENHAWIVNVARGGHIVTDDLVWALSNGVIGGAALDVTYPEPLPADHPLWTLPNCIITPHVGNTPEMAVPLLGERITQNVRRYLSDEPLIGLVDPRAGY
jgi:phosphoglycerate dehydrogenase-like enzyme